MGGLTKKHRKGVTPGQRTALLAHQNKSFLAPSAMQCPKASNDGGSSPSLEGTNIVDPMTHNTNINDGSLNHSATLNAQDVNATRPTTQSYVVDECGDELIFEEEDSEEDYMFGQGTFNTCLCSLPFHVNSNLTM